MFYNLKAGAVVRHNDVRSIFVTVRYRGLPLGASGSRVLRHVVFVQLHVRPVVLQVHGSVARVRFVLGSWSGLALRVMGRLHGFLGGARCG